MPIPITGLTNDGESGTPTDNLSTIQSFLTANGNRGAFQIPKGAYYVSAPLETYGWVDLIGDGTAATSLIANNSTAVLDFKPNPTVSDGTTYRKGSVRGMRLRNKHATGKAITTTGVTDYRGTIEDVDVGAGGIAIDLGTPTCTGFTLRNIWGDEAAEADGGLLGNSILKINGNGVGRIEGLRMNGSTRVGFTTGRPFIEIVTGGTITLCNCWCEWSIPEGATAYFLYAGTGSGSRGINYFDNHYEQHGLMGGGGEDLDRRITDTTGIVLDGCVLFGDHLFTLTSGGRLGLTGSARATFRELDISANGTARLMDLLVLGDATSRLYVDEVISLYDSGCLNHAQITIGRNRYGTGAAVRVIPNPPRTKGGNRVKAASNWTGPTGSGGATVSDSSFTGHEMTVTTSVITTPGTSRVLITAPTGGTTDFLEYEVEWISGGNVTQTFVTDQADNEYRVRAGGNDGLTRVYHPVASPTSVKIYVYQDAPGTFKLKNVATFSEEKSS